MIELYKKNEECSGCGACIASCSRNAITMYLDEFGYQYPIVDDSKCIECKKCLNVCPFTKNRKVKPLHSYAAMNQDKKQRMKSASAGIFAAIADDFLRNDGLVCGAIMEINNGCAKTKHIMIDNQKILFKLQGSKYVQSDAHLVFDEVKSALKAGKKVLFCGTPCQVVAIKNYIGDFEEKFFTIDIICHGVPNSYMFNDYLSFEADKRNIEVEKFLFRDKTYGWGLIGSISGVDYTGKRVKDKITPDTSSYYHYFIEGEIYRESCYNCPFATGERVGDITIGDYWGAQLYNPELMQENGGCFSRKEGISCLLLNTESGKKLIERYGNGIEKKAVEYSNITIINKQLVCPAKHTHLRAKLLVAYQKKGYLGIEKIFNKWKRKKYIKQFIQSFIPKKVIDLIKRR